MLRIEQVRDIDTLRQMAMLLEQENERLVKRVRELTEALSRAKGEDSAHAQQELAFLQELLAKRTRALFGDSSEKRSQATSVVKAARSEQRGHGPRRQPELPLVEQVHELDEDQRRCKRCGGRLQEIPGQTEEAEEVSVVERRFVLVKHRRKKYRCRCNGCIETAPAPAKLKAGSRYAPEFAVEVAVGKYLDHLPLERQVRIMRREGLRIDSQTLWDQLEALARLHQPTYQALAERTLSAALVHADESHWRLMQPGQRKRWWVWGLATEDTVVYRLLGSRSTDAAKAVLGAYRGVVMADGYGAYAALARDGPRFKLVHCWMHARRKFVEIEEHYPEACAEVLELIAKLYALEHQVPGNDEAALTERKRVRNEHSRPLVRELRDWALAQRALPRSGLGQAIHYLLNLWEGLTAFLDDPTIPLDNGAIERGLRGVALGRKNHYGSRSQRGTEVAAILYSLMESAKLVQVDPKAYLLKATHRLIANPNDVLLPHQLLS